MSKHDHGLPLASHHHNLHLLAGIASPKIRREAASKQERLRQAYDPRHMICVHKPASLRLRSRKSFLHCVDPLDQNITTWRAEAWNRKLDESPAYPEMHIKPAEALTPGSDSGWKAWRCLNRLRSGIARTKSSLKKWGFLETTASTLYECGTGEDTVNHRLKCPLLDEPCSTTDLAEFNIRAKQCVKKWESST